MRAGTSFCDSDEWGWAQHIALRGRGCPWRIRSAFRGHPRMLMFTKKWPPFAQLDLTKHARTETPGHPRAPLSRETPSQESPVTGPGPLRARPYVENRQKYAL